MENNSSLFLFENLLESVQVRVVLREEGREGSRHVLGREEESLHGCWPFARLDGVHAELAARRVSGFVNREGGLAELRSLSCHGCIDGEDDAAVGLLKVEVEAVAHHQDAVPLGIGQQGCIHAAVVAVEVEVTSPFCPEPIATCLVATWVGGEWSLAYPLHALDAGVEQECQSHFSTENVCCVGSQVESDSFASISFLPAQVGFHLCVVERQ